MNSSPLRPMIKMAGALVGLLPLQFVLGIIINLYTKFPDTKDQAKLWHFAWTNPLVIAHMVVGTIIVVVAFILLIQAFRSKMRPFMILATIGMIGVLVAGFGGEEFVKTQNDAYSLTMALGFVVAAAVYGRFMSVVLVAQTKIASSTPAQS